MAQGMEYMQDESIVALYLSVDSLQSLDNQAD